MKRQEIKEWMLATLTLDAFAGERRNDASLAEYKGSPLTQEESDEALDVRAELCAEFRKRSNGMHHRLIETEGKRPSEFDK